MNAQTRYQKITFIGVCLSFLISSCSGIAPYQSDSATASGTAEPRSAPAARNVILFIGDGMGVSTVTAMRILDGQNRGMTGEENVLSFERFPHVALSKTYETNQQVSESAGTATAMLTGRKTKAGLIGVSSETVRGNCASANGQNMRTALELAESIGMSTGIVTTTRITHATPAASYAHIPERGWENDRDLTAEAKQNGCIDIAAQLIDFPYGDGIEVALGGGRINFLPKHLEDPEGASMAKGRQDNRNLVQEWTQKFPNSAYIWNQQQFDAIDPANTDHLLGLFSSGHMSYEADRSGDTGGEPSLAEMTKLAIEILGREPEGYFLLVEGGRIDHAHHDNNAYRALHDGIAFADAVRVADEMTSQHDTLIIVTADHSHALTIAGYTTRGNPILGKVITNDWAGNPNTTFDLMDDGNNLIVLGKTVYNGDLVFALDIDTLTGEHRVLRADILHDCGKSLNPAIDMGQIEGGFIQGVGWLTSEELWWNSAGELKTHAPSTYKIPTCSDLPVDFRVRMLESAANCEETIHRSKAVGEPPLMLGLSVFHAIRDAVAAVSGNARIPRLQAPATPEAVLNAVLEQRSAS